MKPGFKNNFCLQIIFLLLFTVSSIASYSQSKVIDSLLNALSTSKEDTSQVNILNTLSQNYGNTGSYKNAMQYALKAKQQAILLEYQKGTAMAYNNLGLSFGYDGKYKIAENNYVLSLRIYQTIGDLRGMAAVYNNLGNLCLDISDYKASMMNHNKALEIRTRIKDKKGMSGSYNNLGNVFRTQGDYEKAIDSYLKSLKIKEEISAQHPEDNAVKRGLGNTYNNIGLIYANQRNHDKALEYYIKALEMRIKADDKQGIGMSYGNIGAVYYGKKQYEKALEYLLKALKINESIGDKYGVALLYDNIGSTYFHLDDFDKALQNHLRAFEMQKEIGDKRGWASAGLNIGRIYSFQQKYDLALQYMNESLQIFKQIQSKTGLNSAYAYLADLYAKTKDYKNAYEFHKLASAMSDTLLNEQSNKQIAEMNVKYDSEKKDKELIRKDAEINHQLAEAEKKKVQRNAFIAGFSLVLVLAFFIFRSYRQKRRVNKQLEEKNKLIAEQKQLVDEKNMKITDSITYAKRIQQATLPSDESVNAAFQSSFVLFMPKDIVSGDFYWHSKIQIPSMGNDANEAGSIELLVVADCTGHGVPGAFMSMIGNTLLNEIVNIKGIHSTAQILTELNKGVVNLLNQGNTTSDTQDDGMDVTILALNTARGEMEYASANHFSYLVSNGQVKQIKGDIYSIGGMFGRSDIKFTSQKLTLDKNSAIYLFTDGYMDQFGGEKNTKFTSARFEELLKNIQHLDMAEQKRTIEQTFLQWKGNNKQLDDILVVGIRL
ncbi:MAG: tetratricopeptide repeat protein [Bacteroidia bacterium]|jgi:tetratricopeptide (TPR) repeat protein